MDGPAAYLLGVRRISSFEEVRIPKPVEIFFSYSHEDEALMNELRRQLVIFERQGRIIKWHDRQIPPGTEWEPQIDERLRSSAIVLLLVSPAFLESRYCYDVEVGTALERHQRGLARVIPVILRPCAWDASPFSVLQALPKDAKPITQWPDRDQVCLDVARSIMAVVDELQHGTPGESGSKRPSIERRAMKGDRIPRILVPFAPPKGINIPPGYQRRLNQISAQIARDSAVRDPSGGYLFPAQFRGAQSDLLAFADQLRASGRLENAGMDDQTDPGEIWFEYSGPMSPDEISDLALALGLVKVHCGATMVLNVDSLGSSGSA